MKKNLIALCALLMCVKLSAQVVIKSNTSPTLTDKGMFGKSEKIAEFILPATVKYNVPKADTKLSYIPSDSRTIDLSFLSKATSEIIGNNIIYRQKIVGLDATSVKVYFDRLKLSQNAQMYIYTPSGSVVTGPVTSAENIGKDRLWGSNRFPGSAVIIELVIPVNEKNENDIHMSKITLGVDKNKFSDPSDPASFGDWGNADVCAQYFHVICGGSTWENERKAVCLIETEDDHAASGALISNTCNLNKPYVLTAHHVTNGRNTNYWQFYFGWWSPYCYDYYTQTALLFNGATFKASYANTDFALVQLFDPLSPSADLTYLGWSRSSSAPTSSAVIHHPGADQMRIAICNTTATSDNVDTYTGTAWKVNYTSGNGAIQGVSSGSPLFNPDKRVVGHLWGGNPGETNCNYRYGIFGRFDLSWTGGGTNSTRLSNWLDPTGTNDMTTNTTPVSNTVSLDPSGWSITGPSQFCTSQNYSVSGLPSSATVTWHKIDGPPLNLPQTGNSITLNRLSDDGDAIIRAYITICGETFYKDKSIRVGGAPITVTTTQLACDQFQFEVSGAETGATYNWSSYYGTVLFNGTSTTATTPYPTIYATTMGGDDPIVNTTNTCSQSVERYGETQNIYLRNIDGLLGIYSNGDQVVCSATTTPYDTYYRWYINGYLDSEGESLSTFATYNYQGMGIVCGDNTIRVEVDACGGTISSDAYHFWKMGNCFGRNNSSSNVELFPNPAFNQTTIRLTDLKESAVKLTAIKSIRITDKMGNFITEVKYTKNSKSVTVDLNRLSIGIYYVEVSDGINKTVLPLNVLR